MIGETIVIKNVDVKLLKRQRNQFLKLLNDNDDSDKRLYLVTKEVDALNGVINMLDNMLDNSSDNKK